MTRSGWRFEGRAAGSRCAAGRRLLGVVAALLAAAFLHGCDGKSSASPIATRAPSQKPADDPRVPCPAGTVQKRYEGGPAHALSIWCVDAEGQKHGPDKTWFLETGKISEQNYDHGATDGIQREWYAEGVLESEDPYRHGVPVGTYRSWHRNGQLRFQVEYRDGEAVGVARWWDEQGRLVKTEKHGGAATSDRSDARSR